MPEKALNCIYSLHKGILIFNRGPSFTGLAVYQSQLDGEG